MKHTFHLQLLFAVGALSVLRLVPGHSCLRASSLPCQPGCGGGWTSRCSLCCMWVFLSLCSIIFAPTWMWRRMNGCSVLYLGVLVFVLCQFYSNLAVEEDSQIGVLFVVPGCSCVCAVTSTPTWMFVCAGTELQAFTANTRQQILIIYQEWLNIFRQMHGFTGNAWSFYAW